MCISKSFFVLFCTFLIFRISSNWKVYLEYWKLPQKSVMGSSAAKADLNEIQCNLFKGRKNEILSRDLGGFTSCLPLLFSCSYMMEQSKKHKSHSTTKISRSSNAQGTRKRKICSLALSHFLISS